MSQPKPDCDPSKFSRKGGSINLCPCQIWLLVAVSAVSILSSCTPRPDFSYSTKLSELETASAAEAISEAQEAEARNSGEMASPSADRVENLKTVLAAEVGAPATEILVEEITPTEWNDACLGLPQPGEICAQVITPGYRIVLSHLTETYEFHTDQTGRNIRRVTATDS
jgi:hypothetical protein